MGFDILRKKSKDYYALLISEKAHFFEILIYFWNVSKERETEESFWIGKKLKKMKIFKNSNY